MTYLQILQEQFGRGLSLRERRPGVFQVIAPLYFEDGDMVDIFLEESETSEGQVKITDHGMTLMRLSYSFDINSENKERIFRRIVEENGLLEENGRLFIVCSRERLYPSILQFAQGVAKVSSLQYLKREISRSMFYEMLEEFVRQNLSMYNPRARYAPLPEREDLEVDHLLEVGSRPLFLFGVKDSPKARLVTISCLEFQKAGLPFRSCVVHEDFESLNYKDQIRLLSASDKQFPSLDDFREHGPDFIRRELA